MIGAPGRVTQSRLKVRAIFAKVMDKPGKPRESLRPEASPPAAGTGRHFSQVAGERLPFFFGTTRYTMSIIFHFGLKSPWLAGS
jgi:hypothetical protein